MGDSAHVRAWLKQRAKARRASRMLAMLSTLMLLAAIGVGVWPFLQRDGSDRRLAAAFDRDEPVRAAAARMFGLSASLQRSLALDASPLVRTVLAGRSDLDSRAADMLCADNDVRVLRVMAGRSDLSDGQKAQLAEIRDARVLESLGLHDAAAFLDSLPFAPAPRAPKRGLFG